MTSRSPIAPDHHMQLQSLQLGVDLAGLTPSASCGPEALAPRLSGSPTACTRRNSSTAPAVAPDTVGSAETRGSFRVLFPTRSPSSSSISRTSSSIIDQLLLIDGPRYGGSTIVASLQAGLAYPNLNQDFDNSTIRRQDRDLRAPYAGDNRIGSPPCSATRWAYRMRDASDAITKYIWT